MTEEQAFARMTEILEQARVDIENARNAFLEHYAIRSALQNAYAEGHPYAEVGA